MPKIDPSRFYTRAEAEAAGCEEQHLRGLQRHAVGDRLLYSGHDLAGVLVLAEEERRHREAEAARRPAKTDAYGLGWPSR